jgi:predicted metal-dependent phosphoesterase TrpH
MSFLKDFPNPIDLANWAEQNLTSEVVETNGHVHTPYSFSSFSSIDQAFDMAVDEGVEILGINDFFVTDGYSEFEKTALEKKVFPLFNIEFIGLLEEEQKKGFRINDPNNPGRTYFSGKGLDHPVSFSENTRKLIDGVLNKSQEQVEEMIKKASALLHEKTGLSIDFDQVKNNYARELVRERHVAKAIRLVIYGSEDSDEGKKEAFKKIFEGKELKSDIDNIAAVENEIRSNLLKKGGKAFVEEDPEAFLPIDRIIEIIIDGGGIPTYPLLLDDKNGSYTDYEGNKERLFEELIKRNIWSIELIPGRNTVEALTDYMKFFYEKGFIVTLGSEHNTPDLPPVKLKAGNGELTSELKEISFNGACLIAAHQYLRAKGEKGYLNSEGMPLREERNDLEVLGRAVFEYFKQK